MNYIKNSWNYFKDIMYPYRYVIYVADVLMIIVLIIVLVREVMGK